MLFFSFVFFSCPSLIITRAIDHHAPTVVLPLFFLTPAACCAEATLGATSRYGAVDLANVLRVSVFLPAPTCVVCVSCVWFVDESGTRALT
jgi:hypothetical protein